MTKHDLFYSLKLYFKGLRLQTLHQQNFSQECVWTYSWINIEKKFSEFYNFDPMNFKLFMGGWIVHIILD